MPSLLSRSKSPIGLDVGTRQVKAIQLARAGRDWRLHAAASFPRNPVAAELTIQEATRMAEVLYRQGFSGRRVVTSISSANVMTSMLELPPHSKEVPLEQIARMELARVHQCESHDFEFAHWEVPAPARASKSSHVMAVACRHEAATPLVDTLESAGFELQAIDSESCALARACAPFGAGAAGLGALLDLGFSAARLTIVHQGVIVYSRVLEEASLAHLCHQLQQQLQIESDAVQHLFAEGFFAEADEQAADEARNVLTTHFDALVRELNVSFSYAAHQYPDAAIRRLLLSGGGADMPGLAEHLGTILGIEVQTVRPADLVSGAEQLINGSSSLVTALGLALYEAAAR